jgi:hypothetical protein
LLRLLYWLRLYILDKIPLLLKLMKGMEGEGILMVVEVGTMMVIQIGTGAMAAAAVGGETVGGEIRNPRI